MSEAIDQRTIGDPVISIGVLAQKVGLSVSAVRKYENAGLIIAYRTDSGRRLFSPEDIERVRNIQHMIQDLGLNIEGIRRMQALLPCWDLAPCDAETRENCPSFNDNTRPCWTIKDLDCAPQGNECRCCIVYRFGSLCTQDIKRLLHDQDRNGNGNGVVRELVLRLKEIREENRSSCPVSG
jgi:MerR family transcriptional regulator/heat shock protein HspR